MSELEQVITWLRTYEGHDILKDWHVDYTDQVPSCGAVFPQGLQEIERSTYITGAVCVTNQSNFGLYFPTAPSTLYSAINDMEQVLWSLHELWQRNSVKQYAGEICAGQEIGVI